MVNNICPFLLLFFPLCIESQDLLLEKKAIEQLCIDVDQYRHEMKDAKIYFGGKVSQRLSSVYDIAYCFGDIQWQEYMEQNSARLDSISGLNKELVLRNSANIEWPRCANISRFPFFKRKKYRVVLKRATRYFDNRSSVLITMFHKPTGHFVLFSVLFDADNSIAKSSFSSYLLD